MSISILAAATGDGTSSSVTLTDGQVANFYLVGASGAPPSLGTTVELQVQSTTGWTAIYFMDVPNNRTARVEGPGVFRCVRTAAQQPVGVECA